jgi:hypothetical protein
LTAKIMFVIFFATLAPVFAQSAPQGGGLDSTPVRITLPVSRRPAHDGVAASHVP